MNGPKKTGRSVAGFTETTTIVIFVLGVSFGSLVKPLWEGFASEAGKDLWTALKKLSAKVWRTQAQKSYRIEPTIEITFELQEEFVKIALRPEEAGRASSLADYEALVEAELTDLAIHWEQVQGDIKKFNVGAEFGSSDVLGNHSGGRKVAVATVHKVQRVRDQWVIHLEDPDASRFR